MRPNGRQNFALLGLIGALAAMLAAPTAGFADTLKAEVELSTKNVGLKETVLGNLFADAMKASAKSDIAFIAADYFTADITVAKGTVSTADILKALESPDDSIAIIKLTGDQIQRGMERSLFLQPKFNSGFLQFSGMTVTYKSENDADKRVLSIKIGDNALESGKTYKVAMPAPLAKGGLSYFKIWKPSDSDKNTEKSISSAVTSYLSDHKTLAKGEERLVNKSKEPK